MANKNMTPMIWEKNADGEFLYDIFSRLSKDRILFLSEAVDSDSAISLASTLLWLDSQNHKPIQLYINSPGGSVDDGFHTIYDMMMYVESPIHTTCIGTAYSAAALLLAAGTPGERRIMPNAMVMIHEVSSGVGGKNSEIQREANLIKNINSSLMKKIALHTGQPLEKVEALCHYDEYFSAEEALKFGLVDKIVKHKKLDLIVKANAEKARESKVEQGPLTRRKKKTIKKLV